jgi:hypothetical protein
MDERDGISDVKATVGRGQGTTAVAKAPKMVDRRIERIRDLVADALQEPDPLRANLRAATADLFELGFRLSTGIKAAMSVTSCSLEDHEAVMPALSNLALLHRQATRYIQLDRAWASERGTAEEPESQPPAGSGNLEK